jgi:hypothetical protein
MRIHFNALEHPHYGTIHAIPGQKLPFKAWTPYRTGTSGGVCTQYLINVSANCVVTVALRIEWPLATYFVAEFSQLVEKPPPMRLARLFNESNLPGCRRLQDALLKTAPQILV